MASPAPSEESTEGDSESQFIPQPDDDETLWEVIEITQEKSKEFKVKWKGVDPKTGRPWPQNWVPKKDCTDDLRRAWRKQLALKKEAAKGKGKGKSRLSKASAAPSSSTLTGGGKPSRSDTLTPTVGSRPPESNATSRSRTVTKQPKPSKRKHKSLETLGSADDHSDRELQLQPEAGPSRPRKRRKVHIETTVDASSPPTQDTQKSFDVVKKKKYGKAVNDEVDIFEQEAWGAADVRPAKKKASKGKGKAKEILPIDDGEEELSDVSEMKMGPPRGVKKYLSGAATKASSMKPRSRKLDTATTSSPLPPTGFVKPRKSKPSPSRFRSSPPLYDETLPIPITKRHPATAEDESDDSHEALQYPESPGQLAYMDPLFLPDTEDPLDFLPPSDPRPQQAGSDDDLFDLDDIQPQLSPEAQTEEPLADAFSPEVPETQSQESSNAPSEPKHTAKILIARPMPSSVPASPNHNLNHQDRTPKHTSPATASSTLPPIVKSHHGKTKSLGPIPRVDPSTFHPHLPTSSPRPQTPDGDEQAEAEVPLSSIEQFSPEKSGEKRVESIGNWGDTSQMDMVMSDDDALRARGHELAYNMHQRRERERARTKELEGEKTKKLLSDLIKTYAKESEPELDHNVDMEEASIVQEMEDTFLDLSGGGDEGDVPPHMHLAQEEEESTQDLLREQELLAQQLAHNSESRQQGWDVVRLTNSSHSDRDRDESPREDPLVDAPRLTPPRTQAKITPLTVHAEGTLEELPATMSPPRPSPNELSRSQTEPLPSQTAGIAHAMNLLHVKSEENAKLTEQRNASAALADALSTKLTEEQSRHVEGKAVWDSERAELLASLDTLKRAKASAETDRDFFREQYAQASGFVSSVRAENIELEKRTTIAEGKTKHGVAMIRAMFGERVKSLEEEVTKSQRKAELYRKQQQKTDDEIRRKAAEYPEMRAKYEDARVESQMLKEVIDELQRDRKALKAKLASREELPWANTRLGSGKPPDGTFAPHGGEFVYRCDWRPGGDMGACLDFFDSREDLEKHMFSDEHLVLGGGYS